MKNNVGKQIEIINKQIKEIAGIYKDEVCRLGISENEFWIWYTLVVIGGEFSQQDICGMWSLSKQTVNTIIAHMTKKELVNLEIVSGARNRKLIRLTEKGKIYGEQIVMPVVMAEQRTIERMPEDDIKACTSVLSKFINILKEEMNEK